MPLGSLPQQHNHSHHALHRRRPAHVPDDDSKAAGPLTPELVRGDDVRTAQEEDDGAPPITSTAGGAHFARSFAFAAVPVVSDEDVAAFDE